MAGRCPLHCPARSASQTREMHCLLTGNLEQRQQVHLAAVLALPSHGSSRAWKDAFPLHPVILMTSHSLRHGGGVGSRAMWVVNIKGPPGSV